MPVFGADPDKQPEEWDDVPTQYRAYVSKPVRDLTNYFAYHRHMRMSQRCNEEDKVKLNVLFSRRLKQGFSSESIREIVDRFYQSPEAQVDFPAALFCTNKVQASLIEGVEMRTDNAVLQWLIDGMPNDDGLFDDSREMRKIVLLSCDESLFRYPTIVAEILRGDTRECQDKLTALENLLLWNLGEDHDVDALLATLERVPLPKVLTTKKRSPKMIAERKPTVQMAVASESVKKKENW